jgi:hypothetical protein
MQSNTVQKQGRRLPGAPVHAKAAAKVTPVTTPPGRQGDGRERSTDPPAQRPRWDAVTEQGRSRAVRTTAGYARRTELDDRELIKRVLVRRVARRGEFLNSAGRPSAAIVSGQD